jgi:glycosyltransferase involved in cell wall biosynthesis
MSSMDRNKSGVLQPFFSIVVATYNRAQLLKRALGSLVAQTETDWEALLVDDGSTDGTYKEVLPYLEAYPAIKYLKKEHTGEAGTKNEGIKKANGKYVTFLDSDDEYDPRHLETRKQILMSHPDVKFLHGGVKVIGNQYVPDRFDPSKTIDLRDCVIGGSFFIARDTLRQLNGFRDIALGTDACLFDRAKEERINIMETREETYIYRRETEDSITNRMSLDRKAPPET